MAGGQAGAAAAAWLTAFAERLFFSAASAHCRGAENDEEFIITVRNCSLWATVRSPGDSEKLARDCLPRARKHTRADVHTSAHARSLWMQLDLCKRRSKSFATYVSKHVMLHLSCE